MAVDVAVPGAVPCRSVQCGRGPSVRAVSLPGGGEVTFAERAVPAARPGHVVLAVSHCALCGSDKRLIRMGADVVPGHEIVGTVVDVGAGAQWAEVGGRAVVYIPLFCGACPQCTRGATHRCTAMAGLVGWQADGGFAEYVAVPARNAVPVPDDIDPVVAVLGLDTIGTAAHGLRRLLVVLDDEDAPVVVLGCGPLGMGVAAVAVHWGRRVGVYDVDPSRARAAVALGAEVLDLAGIAVDEVRKEWNPAVVDASGAAAARALAVGLVGQGEGTLMLGEGGDPWVLPASVEWRRTEAAYVRSFYFPLDQMEENWQILRSVGAQLRRAIVSEATFDEVPRVFGAFVAGEVSKPVVAIGTGGPGPARR